MANFDNSGKLAMDSGVRPEDFNNVKKEGVSDGSFRFWALLEVSKVARKNYRKEKKLQREKDKKEEKRSRAVEGKTASMNEESMRSASEASRTSTGKRKRGDDPDWELETCALAELEDAEEPGFVGMLLSASRKKQRCSKKTDEEANKCSNEDGDHEWNLETRTSSELEEAEGLGLAGASLSRKKCSCREKSNKKVNKKWSMKDDDPEWNSGTRAWSEIEDAEESGFEGKSASLSPSSSRKEGRCPRKKSDNQVNKERAKGSEDRPDMPRELKDHITRVLGGKEVRLVIQKRLTQSDVSDALCRVSIPMNQIIDSEFLREDEKKLLEASVGKDVRVLCYRSPEDDLELGEKVLKLKLWVMNKKPKGQRAAGGTEREPLETSKGGADDTGGGEEQVRSSKKKGELGGMDGGEGPRPSYMYILRSGWPQFLRDNKLELNDAIQIWSFRVDSDLACDELRLALIVLPGKQAREGGSHHLID